MESGKLARSSSSPRAKSLDDAKVTYRIGVFFPRFSGLHEVERETRVTGKGVERTIRFPCIPPPNHACIAG